MKNSFILALLILATSTLSANADVITVVGGSAFETYKVRDESTGAITTSYLVNVDGPAAAAIYRKLETRLLDWPNHREAVKTSANSNWTCIKNLETDQTNCHEKFTAAK